MAECIIRVAVPRPLYRCFDYTLPPELPRPQPGARLRVPFGGGRVIAVCVAVAQHDGARAGEEPVTGARRRRLKPIEAVLDDPPLLDAPLFELLLWAADYYHHPLGETLIGAFPGWLRAGRPVEALTPRFWAPAREAGIERLPRNARRQRACLEMLLETGTALSQEALKQAGFGTAIRAALEARGLIGEVAPPAPGSGSALAREQTRQANGDAATAVTLNPAQHEALGAIDAGLHGFNCFLLQGVTGSGKTEIYLRALAAVLERDHEAGAPQALVLIPEIALTPQTLSRFQARFDAVAAYHSGMGERERARIWDDCRCGRIRVLVGTRSAIFVPFPRLQLIIVDEEHDGSFKQQEGLRYSARDLAVKRARELDIALILGSATPSLESLRNAERGRYQRLRLPERTNAAPPPALKRIDIRGMRLHEGIAPPLEQSMRRHLGQGNQVLLFINRRGFAPTLLCTSCGWRAVCQACDMPMTVHRQLAGLRCHHCGAAGRLPARCPGCDADSLLPLGIGTQRAEAAVAELFPGYPVIRIDRDSTRGARQMSARFEELHRGRPAILVGTQMLAKGHHLPRVTLVGIINADAGLFSTDFRAGEHTAQLIVQVAGRSGRAEQPGEVCIQTYNPDNPLLEALVRDGYEGVARSELAQRDASGLPPARYLAVLRAEAASLEAALGCLETLTATLRRERPDPLEPSEPELLGPAPAPMLKRADRYRAQCLLLSHDRRALHRALGRIVNLHGERRLPNGRWHIDVDPYDLA